MEIYIVGGVVRDRLLGKTPSDIDYLVCGATVEEFLNKFPQAKQVGRDFPVFLVDGEEYAFARTERKNGYGHAGFSTKFDQHVTVIKDLNRRDLTINSIAMSLSGDKIISVHGAIDDIKNKVLRHTSEAFKEDPLRVFRVARFAAQLEGFTVAPETIDLMRSMSSELEHLSAERVFIEMKKALCSDNPRRFFEVLRDCQCLETWFPELLALVGVPVGPNDGKHAGEKDCFDHTMNVVERTTSIEPSLRFAGLCHDFGKSLSESPPKHHGHDSAGVPLVSQFCKRLKVPGKYSKAAMFFCSEHLRMHRIFEMRSGKAVRLIMLAHKTMPCGVMGFLACSSGDGMETSQMLDIMYLSERVVSVKLPDEYRGRGKACADILMQLRCKEWRIGKKEKEK